MAARKNLTHSQEVRERIKVSQLINCLQDNALGDLKKELSMGRIRSIEAILRKAVPDLSAVQMDIEGELGLTVNILRFSEDTDNTNDKPA